MRENKLVSQIIKKLQIRLPRMQSGSVKSRC